MAEGPRHRWQWVHERPLSLCGLHVTSLEQGRTPHPQFLLSCLILKGAQDYLFRISFAEVCVVPLDCSSAP